MTGLRRWLRDPFAVFALVAALLFGVHWALGRSDRTIEVSAATEAALLAEYQLMTGHPADPKQRQKLIDDYVADEILFREAVARGMHLTDRTTRARLVDRLRFQIAGAPDDPSEADMLDFYSEHGELYRAEPQISLEQRFFNRRPADPAAVLAALKRGESVADDDFWMGKRFPNYGESMLRGMFGADVLAAARTAPPGQWQGPFASPRGFHYIRVEARRPAATMRYIDVRDQVRQDLMAARTAAAVTAEVKRMEAKYVVRIAD